jgi:SAM-dependent methyltransferase
MMIDHDNLADYADPILYDLENSDVEPIGSFLLKLAQKINGSVLELGCGTGRYTIHLAQQGLKVTGLDIVPGMLAHAKEKADDLPILWVEEDARSFDLKQKFAFICETGSMFEHLLTRSDQEAMLSCIRKHLAENGRFLISAVFTKPNRMVTNLEEADWYTYEDAQDRTIQVSGTDEYDAVNQIRHETAYRRWQNEAGKTVTKIAPMALYCHFPQELESLLHYNGFHIEEKYGDWDFTPLTSESPMLLYLCTKVKHNRGGVQETKND